VLEEPLLVVFDGGDAFVESVVAEAGWDSETVLEPTDEGVVMLEGVEVAVIAAADGLSCRC
jgi:hypothetical protein